MVRIALFVVLALALMFCPAQALAETTNPQETGRKATYLIIYRPGPAWLTGKSVMEQPLKEHGRYMLSLYIKGSMRLAGPLTDNAGGAVLFGGSYEGEAEAIVGGGPSGKTREFFYEKKPREIHPWGGFAKK